MTDLESEIRRDNGLLRSIRIYREVCRFFLFIMLVIFLLHIQSDIEVAVHKLVGRL